MSEEHFEVNEEPLEGEEVEEVVDGLPILAEIRPLERAPAPTSLPAVQAAAVAMTGFVAGAATLAMVRRRQARRLARREVRSGFDLVPGAGPRTYIVHVQRIGRTGE